MPKIIPARWPRLLTEAAAAEYFSMSVTALRKLDLEIIRIAYRPLYDRHNLDAWVGRQMGNAAADNVDLIDDLPFKHVQQNVAEAYDWRAHQPGLSGTAVAHLTAPAVVAAGRDVFSVGQVAERWSTGTDAVYALVRSGELTHFKLGAKLIRIKRDWIEKYERDRPALSCPARRSIMTMPNWPAAMSRDMALAYTGVASTELRQWERKGMVRFLPLGPHGAKMALRSDLDTLLATLFATSDEDFEFD